MFFWSLFLIVTVKYVLLVMRADNRGEGGILALMALAQRVSVTDTMRNTLSMVGIVGACLFFGDGIITPAISVLSAVEGLEVAAPSLKDYVLPISAVVIIALFAVQYRGTHSVGRVFGPVMALWFVVLAILGVSEIMYRPDILMAISPCVRDRQALRRIWGKYLAFVVLGAVVLCVTGAEALYADMGHFGARPIRLSWMLIVLPALVLNYFGQGALLLRDPAAPENPFFLDGAGMEVAVAAGPAGNGCHGDRQPGGHIRRVFGDATMHAIGLPAATHGAPYLEYRGGPDLHPADEPRRCWSAC